MTSHNKPTLKAEVGCAAMTHFFIISSKWTASFSPSLSPSSLYCVLSTWSPLYRLVDDMNTLSLVRLWVTTSEKNKPGSQPSGPCCSSACCFGQRCLPWLSSLIWGTATLLSAAGHWPVSLCSVHLVWIKDWKILSGVLSLDWIQGPDSGLC